MRIDIKKSLVMTLMATVLGTAAFTAFGAGKAEEEASVPLTAREVFVNLPVSTLDLLTRSTRLDMLDYYDVDSLWQATNTQGGVSVLEAVDTNYLRVRLTPASSLQVALLPLAGDKGQVIMTLYTVGKPGEAADTDIEFLDTEMRPLERRRFFRNPDMKDFFHIPRDSKEKLKELEQGIAFPTVEYNASPGAAGEVSLTGSLTVESRLPLEFREEVARYLIPARDWTWNGKQWRLQPLPKN